MFIVVSYDIPDNKRRTKVMKTLKNFGRHVQYSVFECELKRDDYARLRRQLKELINPRVDNVRFFELCAEDVKKRRIWGVERGEVDVQPWYLVRESNEQPSAMNNEQ
jgi:CRISPR-associated protein Cas2